MATSRSHLIHQQNLQQQQPESQMRLASVPERDDEEDDEKVVEDNPNPSEQQSVEVKAEDPVTIQPTFSPPLPPLTPIMDNETPGNDQQSVQEEPASPTAVPRFNPIKFASNASTPPSPLRCWRKQAWVNCTRRNLPAPPPPPTFLQGYRPRPSAALGIAPPSDDDEEDEEESDDEKEPEKSGGADQPEKKEDEEVTTSKEEGTAPGPESVEGKETQETSGKGQETQETSGEGQETQNTSGESLETHATSGNGQENTETSGEGQENNEKSGESQDKRETSGKGQDNKKETSGEGQEKKKEASGESREGKGTSGEGASHRYEQGAQKEDKKEEKVKSERRLLKARRRGRDIKRNQASFSGHSLFHYRPVNLSTDIPLAAVRPTPSRPLPQLHGPYRPINRPSYTATAAQHQLTAAMRGPTGDRPNYSLFPFPVPQRPMTPPALVHGDQRCGYSLPTLGSSCWVDYRINTNQPSLSYDPNSRLSLMRQQADDTFTGRHQLLRQILQSTNPGGSMDKRKPSATVTSDAAPDDTTSTTVTATPEATAAASTAMTVTATSVASAAAATATSAASLSDAAAEEEQQREDVLKDN